MDYLFLATSVFLIGFYLTAEILSSKRRTFGFIRQVIEPSNPAAGCLSRELVVDLPSGETIIAKAEGCALCKADLFVGSKIPLIKSQSGDWLISFGWGSGK